MLRSLIYTLTRCVPVVPFCATASILPPTANWEADLDTPGDNTWASSVNAASTNPWTFSGSQTPIDVSGDTAGTDFASIQSAYSFPNATAIRPDWQGASVAGGASPSPSSQDATFEFVFRLSDETGNHVLFETGGANRGTSVTLTGTTLTFRAQQGTTAGTFAEASVTNLAVGVFHQVVATIDMNADVIQTIQVFHNGTFVDSAGPADDGADPDWDGSDDAGLGRVNGAITAGTFTNFDGDIAIMRYYRDQVFDATDAQQNFDALVPEPSSLALLGLGGLLVARRRQRH